MIGSVALALGMFLAMFIFMEVGRRVGISRLKNDPEGFQKGIGTVEGAIFGLLGLLIAFTFSGAASRFEDRRWLITEETNNIGTAYLRIGLLATEDQPKMKALFREYLDSRIATYKKVPDMAAVKAEYNNSVRLQQEIWDFSLVAGKNPNAMPDAIKLMTPSLNDMIDITTTRLIAVETHPPIIIFGMLTVLSLISALLAGFGMAGSKNRSLLHMVAFAVMMPMIIYVIMDLEYPRLGFIRIDQADHVMMELRESMN
ncbi:MAG TPA: DUF4239 domain-containing protein [Bacteroidia bacterium]|nr:DUF4239 domain-containing protein [Bacteroidia bacterium]